MYCPYLYALFPSSLPSFIHSANIFGAPIMSNAECGHVFYAASTLQKEGHHMEIQQRMVNNTQTTTVNEAGSSSRTSS